VKREENNEPSSPKATREELPPSQLSPRQVDLILYSQVEEVRRPKSQEQKLIPPTK
jgi:hypothetical protein